MAETKAQERKRLLAERDAICERLEGTDLVLHGWNTVDDFAVIYKDAVFSVNPAMLHVLDLFQADKRIARE